jgi:RimJ/RimL family protein N-acetyltransferase
MLTVDQLSPSEYHRAAPLFASVWVDKAVIDSVLEGRCQGQVFVDDAGQPRAALLCYPGGDYFVIGDPSAAGLLRFLADAPAEVEVFSRPHFAYFLPDVRWQEPLQRAGVRRFHPSRAFLFRAGEIAPPEAWPVTVEAGIVPMDGDLLARVDSGAIQAGHEMDRDHLARIVGESFGFCALVDDHIASSAYIYGWSSRYASIFIDTEEPYRRRGLAARTCAVLIRRCLELGLMPVWNCLESNVASARLALKLGFDEGTPQCESDWQPYGPDFTPTGGLWQAEAIQPPGVIRWRLDGQ